MQLRSVVLVSIALFVGIAAFVLHLSAMCSPHWKIIKRDLEPKMTPVSYGLWQRCEYLNITVSKQGVALGMRSNVEVCQPNVYMRYSSSDFQKCYPIRRNCAVIEKSQLPAGCSCRYLPSAKGLQWLTILAAIFLALGLLLLYLNTVVSSENSSAAFVLGYGPFICFLLTLLLMITGLILLGAYLRRDTYEDYSFPLKAVSNNDRVLQTFDLHSLRNYAKFYGETFTHENYLKAVEELRLDANSAYHTVIGRATIYEIIATALVVVVTALTFYLGSLSRQNQV